MGSFGQVSTSPHVRNTSTKYLRSPFPKVPGGASQIFKVHASLRTSLSCPPLSLGTYGTIDDGAKHKRMNEALKSSNHAVTLRKSTQSGAAVVVVLVRCLDLLGGLHELDTVGPKVVTRSAGARATPAFGRHHAPTGQYLGKFIPRRSH